ncbi:MAG TPA: hypothetical protein EYP36_09275, partial [Calditrichaeota bacterium]|nr:hypothetical protein [Calditrichota bacterium]
SAYMGYAMQLYARKHDMLFHVLAAPEALEANPFFYYPPKNKQNFVFKNRNGETISVPYDQIKIFNAEIPFIRLREILPFIHGPEAMKYEDLVEMTQKEINKVFAPQLIIKKQERTIDVKWREKIWTIKLKPIDLAFYLYMLQEKSIINSKNNEHEDKITEIYLEIRPDVDREDKLTLPDYTYKGLIDSRARINRKIKEKIKFEKMQRFIIIHSRQTDRIASYSVDLPQDFSADFIQIN